MSFSSNGRQNIWRLRSLIDSKTPAVPAKERERAPVGQQASVVQVLIRTCLGGASCNGLAVKELSIVSAGDKLQLWVGWSGSEWSMTNSRLDIYQRLNDQTISKSDSGRYICSSASGEPVIFLCGMTIPFGCFTLIHLAPLNVRPMNGLGT